MRDGYQPVARVERPRLERRNSPSPMMIIKAKKGDQAFMIWPPVYLPLS